MTEITATELSRNLSAYLNRVADGEEVTVTRGGRVIAQVIPPRRQWMPWSEFLNVLENSPSPDPEFGNDLARIREEFNSMPERSTPLEWD
ncbi:MAG: type II toxin-antitoxin system prevent-host-death family antitoxin [Solirubrobacterales bacterium]|nr:type II toxin-antitoxin system prevent-host-death family antitoxin [Solirubrobacterales bacterium]